MVPFAVLDEGKKAILNTPKAIQMLGNCLDIYDAATVLHNLAFFSNKDSLPKFIDQGIISRLIDSLKIPDYCDNAVIVLCELASYPVYRDLIIAVPNAESTLVKYLEVPHGDRNETAACVLGHLASNPEGKQAILAAPNAILSLVKCVNNFHQSGGVRFVLEELISSNEGKRAFIATPEAISILVQNLQSCNTCSAVILANLATSDDGKKALLEVDQLTEGLFECLNPSLKSRKLQGAIACARISEANNDEFFQGKKTFREVVDQLIEGSSESLQLYAQLETLQASATMLYDRLSELNNEAFFQKMAILGYSPAQEWLKTNSKEH